MSALSQAELAATGAPAADAAPGHAAPGLDAAPAPPSVAGLDEPAAGLDDAEHAPDSAAPAPVPELTLVCKDGSGARVSFDRRAAARHSALIAVSLGDDADAQEIDVDVDAPTLRIVEAWVRHHAATVEFAEIPRPLPGAVLHEFMPHWDADFVCNLSQEQLFNTICAANYMDIPRLLQMCGARVAALCIDKTPAQIRATFGIESNMTAEEEERLLKDSAYWLNLDSETPGAQSALAEAAR